MNKTNNQQEVSALCASVNEFVKEMKDELHICALRGKRGWDKHSSEALRNSLLDHLDQAHGKLTKTQLEKLMIDIANFAMMTHKALKDGR